MPAKTITLAHGSGGQAMHDLIRQVFTQRFVPTVGEPAPLEDQARFTLETLASHGDRLAFTTDSYVVDPLFFPGGDIGTLAVNGTINDLAVGGAKPLYLSCSVILEEGLPIDTLERIADSMRAAAVAAGVAVVTGDTKVVHHGAADKLFINTAGIGVIPERVDVGAHRCRPGDVILVSGFIGDHGVAILDARGELALDSQVASDCGPLHDLVGGMLQACPEIRAMRDATRGGIAAVLNEFSRASGCCMYLDRTALPIREPVRGVCEILGLDPLYLANEGKLVCVLPAAAGDELLAVMRAHPHGRQAGIIGEVVAKPAGTVVLRTELGGERIVDMPAGEQLPRIC